MNPCMVMHGRILHHKVVVVTRDSIISKNEASTMVLCLLCSPRYTGARIKNCYKSTSVLK